jgi:isoamylase
MATTYPVQGTDLASEQGTAYQVEPGRLHPLGAVSDAEGVNFSLFSEHATSVELLLFAEPNAPEPAQVIRLDPQQNRTFHFWHVYVRGLKPGVHYAYRLDGPHDPQDLHEQGHRFNHNKVLIDPYSRGNATALWSRADALSPGDNLHSSMRSVVVDSSGYDWEGDQPLKRPLKDSIIYELHVGGFTRSPSSGCQHPGTFEAIIEKIPYLQALGVTAVELLPVFAFDETGVQRTNPLTGEKLEDYWGYNPVSHFAPHPTYCLSPEEGSHIRDFRDMVKALHKAGIEVILDVVFNHTSEGGADGPTINFKGIDNNIYYLLNPQDRGVYLNYAGTGNTCNCNHPLTEKLIAECLTFWVTEMHVDGFRFDEGSILSLDGEGNLLQYPPIIWHITLDETLADTKAIAEAWDAAGLYQVGSFPGERWCEWNGRYRDDIRRFVKGDPGLVGSVATRIAGSSDLYQVVGRLPINSINIITCHDGFTLNDLVSYNDKHNEANGENNRDGSDANDSWNCGVEGLTDDPAIEALRLRQIKNFLAILLLSQGVPMLLAGDEIRRTQQGNNNAYCQNNALGWFDWQLAEKNADLLHFCQRMIAFRKAHPNLRRDHFLRGDGDAYGPKEVDWHGCKLFSPGWFDPDSRVLAFTLWGNGEDNDIHVILNMDMQDLDFEIPRLQGKRWYQVINTSLPSPQDIAEADQEVAYDADSYRVAKHSVVALISK